MLPRCTFIKGARGTRHTPGITQGHFLEGFTRNGAQRSPRTVAPEAEREGDMLFTVLLAAFFTSCTGLLKQSKILETLGTP